MMLSPIPLNRKAGPVKTMLSPPINRVGPFSIFDGLRVNLSNKATKTFYSGGGPVQ